jgi:hypothetical protein
MSCAPARTSTSTTRLHERVGALAAEVVDRLDGLGVDAAAQGIAHDGDECRVARERRRPAAQDDGVARTQRQAAMSTVTFGRAS